MGLFDDLRRRLCAPSVYLMRKDPALLARRMRRGPMFEKEGTQRIIMTFTSLGFIAILVTPELVRTRAAAPDCLPDP
jgi:hypothetical protein